MIYLAPMAEISHRALRELIEEFGGCDEYFSEMLSASAVVQNGPFESFYLDSGPAPEKFVYQLCASEAAPLARAAAFLDTKNCKGIDINMGCSAPAIIKTGAGGAWLYDTEKAALMIRTVRKVTSKRLSVKIRIGIKDDFEYLKKFCKMLENEGVDLITLHPRTTKEKFKRSARWSYITELRQILKIPLIGNGDINTAPLLYERAKAGDVMIGRLAVKEPWVFAQVKAMLNGEESTQINLEDTAFRFLELLEMYQPPEFFISRTRRFFSYFCTNFKWGEYLKNLLFRETDLDKIRLLLKEFFNSNYND